MLALALALCHSLSSLCSFCFVACVCLNPTWQPLPLFVPQFGGQIDIDSVRGQTDTRLHRTGAIPSSFPSPIHSSSLPHSSIPLFTLPTSEEEEHPSLPFPPTLPLLSSYASPPGSVPGGRGTMLKEPESLGDGLECLPPKRTSRRNCAYVSLACLSCMYALTALSLGLQKRGQKQWMQV